MCRNTMDCLPKWMNFFLCPTLKMGLGKKSNDGMLLDYCHFNYVWKDKYSTVVMTKTFLDSFLVSSIAVKRAGSRAFPRRWRSG